MANFNATNPLVSVYFSTYNYGGTYIVPTLSAVAVIGAHAANSLSYILSGNSGVNNLTTLSSTTNFVASASLNLNLATAVVGTLTGLSAVTPPLLTFLGTNGNQSSQGFVSSSTLNTILSTASFTIDFDALAFHETTFALSAIRTAIADNNSQIDNPFYQNGDMSAYTGVIPTAPLGAPALSSTNLTFRTVAQHARRIGQENQ